MATRGQPQRSTFLRTAPAVCGAGLMQLWVLGACRVRFYGRANPSATSAPPTTVLNARTWRRINGARSSVVIAPGSHPRRKGTPLTAHHLPNAACTKKVRSDRLTDD